MNAQWSRESVPDDRAEAGAVGRSGHLGHVDADRAAEETGRGAHHEAAEVQEDGVGSGGLCGPIESLKNRTKINGPWSPKFELDHW